MRTEIVARLIEGTDFTAFRDIARRCLEARGFRQPIVSDGWSDGGRDVRVYETQGLTPLRFAVQVTVEQPPWKAKLRADLRRAQTALNCHSFMFVSSRRIADAEFQKEVDRARDEDGVTLTKMDQQDIAGLLDAPEQERWLLAKLGIPVEPLPEDPPSIRREAAEAFVLFSNAARDFRTEIVRQAAIVSALRREHWTRDELTANATAVLGGGDGQTSAVRGAIDSLLQDGTLISEGGSISVAGVKRETYERTRALVAAEYDLLLRDIGAVLKQYLPKKAEIAAAAKNVTAQLGRILTAATTRQPLRLKTR